MPTPQEEPEDALAALDFKLRVLTITEDEYGIIAINHAGMSEMRALWLLDSAKHLILTGYWGADDDDENADEDEEEEA